LCSSWFFALPHAAAATDLSQAAPLDRTEFRQAIKTRRDPALVPASRLAFRDKISPTHQTKIRPATVSVTHRRSIASPALESFIALARST
jgi:hypothetical protein